jgi:hypothetical protein
VILSGLGEMSGRSNVLWCLELGSMRLRVVSANPTFYVVLTVMYIDSSCYLMIRSKRAPKVSTRQAPTQRAQHASAQRPNQQPYSLSMDLDCWTRARPPTSIAKFKDFEPVPGPLAHKTAFSDDFHEGGPLSRRFEGCGGSLTGRCWMGLMVGVRRERGSNQSIDQSSINLLEPI